MRDIWETWVSDQAIDDFLADALVAEEALPDRRAAFVADAGYLLPDRGRAGPDHAEGGLSAVKQGELLLAHATAADRRGRPGPAAQGCRRGRMPRCPCTPS
jgi:hypothetical protein